MLLDFNFHNVCKTFIRKKKRVHLRESRTSYLVQLHVFKREPSVERKTEQSLQVRRGVRYFISRDSEEELTSLVS